MIDTIAFTTAAALQHHWLQPSVPWPDWKRKLTNDRSSKYESQSLTIYCGNLGINVFGSGIWIKSVRANLPKLLWGHNARVIQTEDQLELALSRLEHLMRLLATPLIPNDAIVPARKLRTVNCHFTRIDLAWQFPFSSGVYTALKLARHRKVRAAVSEIKGETVQHRGSLIEILCYNKEAEMRRPCTPLQPMRVEIRVKNKALRDCYRFGNGRGYDRIDFHWCRETIRLIAGETESPAVTLLPGGIRQFLGISIRTRRCCPWSKDIFCRKGYHDNRQGNYGAIFQRGDRCELEPAISPIFPRKLRGILPLRLCCQKQRSPSRIGLCKSFRLARLL